MNQSDHFVRAKITAAWKSVYIRLGKSPINDFRDNKFVLMSSFLVSK